MTILQTDVDKLIKLVDEKGSISIKEAAKELNVSKLLIEDWANFLEEEGLIKREYKLTDEFLTARKVNKEEINKKEKELSLRKDTLIKKAEDLLSKTNIREKEFSGLKEDFLELKKYLGKNIDKVHRAMEEIEEYNKLKRQSEKSLEKERREYELKMRSVERVLNEEEKKYSDVLNKIKEKENSLKKESGEVEELKGNEDELLKRLNQIREATEETRKRINYNDKKREAVKEEINYLKKIADKISGDLMIRKSRLDKLVEESRKKEEYLAKKQEALIQNLASEFKKGESVNIGISEKLKNFFNKKRKIEELLKKGEGEEEEVKKELIQFIRKLKALNYSKKTHQEDIKEVAKVYNNIEKKKGLFDRYQEEVKKLLKGLETKSK